MCRIEKISQNKFDLDFSEENENEDSNLLLPSAMLELLNIKKLNPFFEPIDKQVKWFYFKNTPDLLRLAGEIHKANKKSGKAKEEALNKVESEFKDYRDETDEEKVIIKHQICLER
jgi:hypothetical protein